MCVCVCVCVCVFVCWPVCVWGVCVWVWQWHLQVVFVHSLCICPYVCLTSLCPYICMVHVNLCVCVCVCVCVRVCARVCVHAHILGMFVFLFKTSWYMTVCVCFCASICEAFFLLLIGVNFSKENFPPCVNHVALFRPLGASQAVTVPTCCLRMVYTWWPPDILNTI